MDEAIDRDTIPEPGPSSPSEAMFWLIARMHSERQPHFVRQIEFRDQLDCAALERALGAIVDRNDALRTTFAAKRIRAPGSTGLKQQLVRSVQERVQWQLTKVDLRSHAESATSSLTEAIRVERAEPFDSSTGPLFQFTLFQRADDEHTLLLTVSHIIADAWSMGLLLRDLRTFYNHYRTSLAPVPRPQRPQASEYVAWYWKTVNREGYLAKSLSYWGNHLRSADWGNHGLPRDRSRTQVSAYTYLPHSVEGCLASTSDLFEFNRRHGLTRVTVPLAAYALMLGRTSASLNFQIANVVHGRFNSRLEDVVGLLSNMMVTEIELDPDQDVVQWLSRLQLRYLAGLRHGVVAVTTVMKHMTDIGKMPPDYLMDNAFPKVLFNMFGINEAGLDRDSKFEGVQATRVVAGGAAPTLYELTLHVWWDGEAMKYRVGGWSDLYDRSTIERMAAAYRTALDTLIDATPRRVSDFL